MYIPGVRYLQQTVWWEGPSWLQLSPSDWPRRPDINLLNELPELKPVVLIAHPPPEEYGTRSSSFSKLCRVTASMGNSFLQSTPQDVHKQTATSHSVRAED